MPIIPPVTLAPYDTADYVLKMARTFVNDAAQSLNGNLLSSSQPYTYVYLNSAWRKLQDELMNQGVETFPNEIVITGLPIVKSLDPAVQTWMGFTNFFDGVNTLATPLLPQDLVIPLRMWERITGTQAIFIDMFPTNDGLPSRTKTNWLRQWDWRDDKIFFVGATIGTDVRLRYNRYLPDIPEVGTSPIPILRCAKALAYYIASEFAASRGSPLSGDFMTKGDDAVYQMCNRTARKQQRGNHRRQPYSARGRSGYGFGSF